MLERIKNGWELVKRSLSVLKADKEIVMFPVLSVIFTLMLTGVFIFLVVAGGLLSLTVSENLADATVYLIFLAYMIAVYFVSVFFKAAVITSATIRLNGKNPSFGDGLKTPARHILRILVWALILVAVNIILSMIRGAGKNKSRGIQIGTEAGAAVAETAWNLLTYFTIPIIIFEELSMWQSMKKSMQLFKETWGENITAQFSVGGIFFLIFLVALVPFIISILTGVAALMMITFVAMLAVMAIIAVIQSSVNGILVASLYYYATKGKIPSVFDGGMLNRMFVRKK